MGNYLLLLVAAFLLGAIPFAYLFVRAVLRQDVRQSGSGNPGATNAARLFPKPWRIPGFLFIFLLDAGKGFVACAVLPTLWPGLPEHAPAAAALAAVLGHSFSPFLAFKGGKGVATTLGCLFALEPLATAIALATFFVIYGATRVVAAGSLGIAIALPAAVFLHGEAHLSVGLLASLLGALIIVRHRSNIARMLRREET
ncbi:MAG: glycerol-3-phosphate 1-O-acyltransferase PlsY [Planctomycetota bacterium]